MKKLAQLLLLICCFLPSINAQEKEKKYNHDNSYYLAGAVPIEDGKVVFNKEFSIPGMNQQEIYNRIQDWMNQHFKNNQNNSRVVFTNPEKGQIVGIGEEWIVFQSSALSLDRTLIKYQLTATCQPEKCVLDIEKIRFEYREGEEKYTAEEWIADKYALNKAKTKLVRGLAKWRKKTVDFADELGEEAAAALSTSQEATAQTAAAKEEEEPATKKNAPIVIQPKQTVTIAKAEPAATSVVMKAATVTSPGTTAKTLATEEKNSANAYKEINPNELSGDLIKMGAGKLVLVIGNDEFNMTMMTANAGGSLGKMSGKPVIFSFLTPDQPYETLEKAETYTVRFYPNGQDKPSVVLECKKLPSQAPLEGQPRMYIGEIIKAKTL